MHKYVEPYTARASPGRPPLKASLGAAAFLTLGVAACGGFWQVLGLYALLAGPSLMFAPLVSALRLWLGDKTKNPEGAWTTGGSEEEVDKLDRA